MLFEHRLLSRCLVCRRLYLLKIHPELKCSPALSDGPSEISMFHRLELTIGPIQSHCIYVAASREGYAFRHGTTWGSVITGLAVSADSVLNS